MTLLRLNGIKFVKPSIYEAFNRKRSTIHRSITFSSRGVEYPIPLKSGLLLPFYGDDKKHYSKLVHLEKLFNMPIFTQDFR